MAAYNPCSSASQWEYRKPRSYDEDDYDSDEKYYDAEDYSYDEDYYDNAEEEEEEMEEEEEEYDYMVSEVLENHVPQTWTEMNEDYETCKLVNLPKNCKEFSDVVSQIHSTLKINVDKVQRIQNPYLWGQYLLKKGEYIKRLKTPLREKKLFHATAEHNVPSIAQNNFDWTRTVRSKFGRGVSFSPLADYAERYCNTKAGNRRALILTRVLVGRAHGGHPNCQSPKEGFDTTTGNKSRVYVKYCDNEFFPEYVAYYKK